MNPAPIDVSKLQLQPFLDLNNRHPIEVGRPLTAEEFARLVRMATYVRGYIDPPAFLLALDQDAPYDNVNFAWFKARYAKFSYVDRVLVDARARGQGYARSMYEDLFSVMKAGGHTMVCAEINSDPPNPASDALHQAIGFETVGSAFLPDRGKTVRYIRRTL